MTSEPPPPKTMSSPRRVSKKSGTTVPLIWSLPSVDRRLAVILLSIVCGDHSPFDKDIKAGCAPARCSSHHLAGLFCATLLLFLEGTPGHCPGSRCPRPRAVEISYLVQ